jgi:hypothetical protein
MSDSDCCTFQRVPTKKSGGPQYVQITTQEWENVLLTLERLKRAVRELGVDVWGIILRNIVTTGHSDTSSDQSDTFIDLSDTSDHGLAYNDRSNLSTSHHFVSLFVKCGKFADPSFIRSGVSFFSICYFSVSENCRVRVVEIVGLLCYWWNVSHIMFLDHMIDQYFGYFKLCWGCHCFSVRCYLFAFRQDLLL